MQQKGRRLKNAKRCPEAETKISITVNITVFAEHENSMCTITDST